MWSECRCVAGPLSALCHGQKTLLLVGGGHAALPSLPQIYSSRGRRPSSGHSLCHAGKSPPKPRPVRMYLLHGVSPSSMLLCLTLLPSLSSFVIPKGFPFSSRRISLLCRVVFGNLSVQQGGIQQRGGVGAVPSFSLREVVLILGPVFDGPIVSF